jgi:hypothetical protein
MSNICLLKSLKLKLAERKQNEIEVKEINKQRAKTRK